MAEIKVSQLPEASEINDNDLIMIVQNNVNKKITKENCKFASGDEVAVSDTEPTGEESDSVKLWINPEETPSGSLNPITNEYSIATDKGYSCNYINGKLEEIGELVWVNLYGGGSYAGKEITASLSNYTSFKIYYFVDNNLSQILEKVGNKDTNIALNLGTAYTRTIAITNSKITIGDGYYSGSVNNNAIIPAYIIGYK